MHLLTEAAELTQTSNDSYISINRFAYAGRGFRTKLEERRGVALAVPSFGFCCVKPRRSLLRPAGIDGAEAGGGPAAPVPRLTFSRAGNMDGSETGSIGN